MKNKLDFLVFMKLENAYERLDRKTMWQVLEIYGVEGKVYAGKKSFL